MQLSTQLPSSHSSCCCVGTPTAGRVLLLPTVVSVALVMVIMGGVSGLIVDPTVVSMDGPSWYRLEQFAMYKGGVVDLVVTQQLGEFPRPMKISFGVCTRRETLKGGTVCTREGEWGFNCTAEFPIEGEYTHIKYEVPRSLVWDICAKSCELLPISFTYYGNLTNPGGDQLDASEIPLKWMHIAFVIVWSLMAFLWILNWIKFRHQKSKLHRVITSFPGIKILISTFSIAVLWRLSATGEATLALLLPYALCLPFVDAIFIGIMLLLAKGWGITHDVLGRFRYALAGLVFGMLCFGFLRYFFAGWFSLLTFAIWGISFFIVFRETNYNIFEQDSISHQESGETHSNKHKIMRDMFRRFRVLLLAYVLCSVMIIAFGAFITFTMYSWIIVFLQELILLIIFAIILFTFRLRPVNLYYRQWGDPTMEISSHSIAPAGNVEMTQFHIATLPPPSDTMGTTTTTTTTSG
ncbi:hypothetical protein Pelo_10380 [Pelomyxa schiedti]|nr:hypothetical protein Pelo_10380 [Pelomyxa schiedti]